MEFRKCVFVDERFINKAQFDAGFHIVFIQKDGAVPAIKDPGHESELQTVSEKTSNVYVLLAIGAQVLFKTPPTARLQELAVFGENRKAVSFFNKYDKTKDFLEIWRMQYYRYSRLTWDWVKLCVIFPNGKQELIKCKTVTWMQCKSLWIKASAKCINVNVMPPLKSIYTVRHFKGFLQ